MRLIGACEQTERSLALFALVHECVDGFEMGIVLLARVFEWEDLRRVDVLLATKRYAIT